ncbi:MAG TPA: hypothetical protein VGN04_16895 [Herbaspirillum sp.]|jgi:hypothetical protein
MVTSTLDPDLIRGSDRRLGTGHDNDALGYSDSSDSGSDLSGLHAAGDDTDSQGTGERASVDPESGRLEGDIDDEDIEDTDVGDDFAENDEIDPDIPVDTDEDDPALSEEEQIRDLNLDIDEIEND